MPKYGEGSVLYRLTQVEGTRKIVKLGWRKYIIGGYRWYAKHNGLWYRIHEYDAHGKPARIPYIKPERGYPTIDECAKAYGEVMHDRS